MFTDKELETIKQSLKRTISGNEMMLKCYINVPIDLTEEQTKTINTLIKVETDSIDACTKIINHIDMFLNFTTVL